MQSPVAVQSFGAFCCLRDKYYLKGNLLQDKITLIVKLYKMKIKKLLSAGSSKDKGFKNI
ncbi:hypothetical protein DBL02_12820 [Acinetobacter oleivorans]|nr:hypothetical protein DBL02_12820 [Acinetobacter oleivorans]